MGHTLHGHLTRRGIFGLAPIAQKSVSLSSFWLYVGQSPLSQIQLFLLASVSGTCIHISRFTFCWLR